MRTALTLLLLGLPLNAAEISVTQTPEMVSIETDSLSAKIRLKGYVSGVDAGTLVDKKTGAKDLGFGLHIMDFLMAPGWADDAYERTEKYHGKLAKHFVEGPQVCTRAKSLEAVVTRGRDSVAVTMSFRFTEPGKGFKAGSTWTQTLVFENGKRWFLSSEAITSANDVEDLFYRIDMPGHIRHKNGDSFEQIWLSYRDEPIPASEFKEDFAPDAKFLYTRDDARIPARMIRAYRVRLGGKPGPWLAGMTLDPGEVCEGWCHQRGYVSFIQELHRKKVKAGETFGAAYVVGWFDDIAEMEKTYDAHKGTKSIRLTKDGYERVK